MWLSQLLRNIYTVPAPVDCNINHLTLDSRHIQQNDLFLAIKGTHTDGRQFIKNAIESGAAAVLYDADAAAAHDQLRIEQQAALIPIEGLRNRLGELAARFYHHPAKRLRMLGITGTYGKTSCSHYIAQVLDELQIHCGIIGTLGHGFHDHLSNVGCKLILHAISLQSMLNEFCKQEVKTVSMEVSSHSLDQDRIKWDFF